MSEASPSASRLPTPSWLDLRLVLGVVGVLVSVVVGARVFASADRFTEVYVARGDLVPGEHLRSGDLAVGEVRFAGEGGSYVAAGREPVGYVVTRFVRAGELLPADAVSATAPDAGSRFVTVPVLPGHLPTDLGRADLVDVYVTAKGGALGRAAPSRVLTAVPVDAVDDGSESLSGSAAESVVLVVPADQVAAAIGAVETGVIDLVAVPAPPATR